MELYALAELTAGYAERMRRLALFDPLYELERKREKDQLDKMIDMKGLGLLTLLFFFEQKLMRQYKTGRVELAFFLKKMTASVYVLNEDRYDQLADILIETFRPSRGKKRTFPFFNWETKQDEELEYSLLKAHDFDAATNKQYYTLDEDGLELVFATKEFYSEFQLSISQLMLRKQLEKGEFRGALRELNEMRIEMESLGERILRVQHEIQRNIISEDTFERYRELLEDIHDRLQRENEEFKELRQFVKETKDRLYEQDHTKVEMESYTLILKVTTELEEVHYDHSRLLQKSMELKNKTLAAAQESFYYTGIDSFNFDQDVVAQMISKPLPFEAMEGVLHPFFDIEQTKQWSLLTIFGKQTITNKEEEERESGFLTMNQHAENDEEQAILRQNYGKLMELISEDIGNDLTLHLDHFIEHVKAGEDAWLLEERYFYDFWMLLHQRSPVSKQVEDDSELEQQHLLSEVVKQLHGSMLEIVEKPEILHVNERFSIQNMTLIVKKGETNAI